MVKKKTKFISVQLSEYLIKDVDEYLIVRNSKQSRASLISDVLENFLDTQYSGMVDFEGKKEAVCSPRAKRHKIILTLQSPSLNKKDRKKLIEEYKKLTEEIEKD